MSHHSRWGWWDTTYCSWPTYYDRLRGACHWLSVLSLSTTDAKISQHIGL